MLISIILKSALVGLNTYVLARLFNHAKLFLDGIDISKQLMSKKCTRLPLITLEDVNRINELERAKQCLQNTRLSDLSLSFFNIMSEAISVGSVSFVLASFDPWLIPISLILFKLFANKRSVKEIRVMCGGDYLEN